MSVCLLSDSTRLDIFVTERQRSTVFDKVSLIFQNETKAELLVCFPHLGTLWSGCLQEPLGGFPWVERQRLAEVPLRHPAHKSDSVFCFPDLYENEQRREHDMFIASFVSLD